MIRRVIPMLIALVTLAVFENASAQTAGPSEDARRPFEAQLVGRTVTLNAPLYSVVATSTSTRAIARISGDRVVTGTSENPAKQTGVNVLSPANGSFFRYVDFSNGLNEVADGDIERFMERLHAMRRGASQARLLTYAAGTRLTVRSVEWNRRLVHLTLDDPIAAETMAGRNAVDSATSISVLWPSDLSKDFSEQAQVVDLLRRLIAFE